MKICIQYEHDNLDALLTLALGSLTGEKLTGTATEVSPEGIHRLMQYAICKLEGVGRSYPEELTVTVTNMYKINT